MECHLTEDEVLQLDPQTREGYKSQGDYAREAARRLLGVEPISASSDPEEVREEVAALNFYRNFPEFAEEAGRIRAARRDAELGHSWPDEEAQRKATRGALSLTLAQAS